MEPEKGASPNANTPPSSAPSQYPLASGVRAMATMGPCRGKLPAEPSKLASPNAKTPPSALANTYPLPSAVAAPEKTGELRGCGIGGAVRPTLPKPIMPPSL